MLGLSKDIRLRPERFGGLAFNPRTGTTVDLDHEAFRLLEQAAGAPGRIEDEAGQPITRNSTDTVFAVVEELLSLGFLEPSTPVPREESPPVQGRTAQRPAWSANGAQAGATHCLSAPETVHWAPTYRCPARCPDCYAERYRCSAGGELDTDESKRLMDRIADWGVFQLAIGGGEPLVRDDIADLAAHARASGLSVHLTTGFNNVEPGAIERLAPWLDCLQVGIPPDVLDFDSILERLRGLAGIAIPAVGFNIVLTNNLAEHIEETAEMLVGTGVRRVTLLRYKPPPSTGRWIAQTPRLTVLKQFHHRLENVRRSYPGLSVRIDCALSFLQRHLPEETAARAGIRGCVAADRIAAVAPDGTVYPCSQLMHPRQALGNLCREEPHSLWYTGEAARHFRRLRKRKSFKRSACGVCRAGRHCGGCRVFAHHFDDEDTGCPQPVLPPLGNMNRRERMVDARRYYRYRGGISVQDYMKRYGVGFRKAKSELRSIPGACLPEDTPRKKHRKARDYSVAWPDSIGDIQDSIGCTSGGRPFVSRAEIRRWQGEGDDIAPYPLWALNSARFEEAEEPSYIDKA